LAGRRSRGGNFAKNGAQNNLVQILHGAFLLEMICQRAATAA